MRLNSKLYFVNKISPFLKHAQKKYFDSEYQGFLKDHCMRDAASRLVWTLRSKEVSDAEISRVVKEKFHYSDAEVAEMLNGAR